MPDDDTPELEYLDPPGTPPPSQARADQLVLLGHGIAAAGKPTNTSAPVITGTGTVGQTLTCSNTGTWNGQPFGYNFQWKRAGADIAGATSDTYLLVAADSAKSLTCSVAGVNIMGAGVAVASNAIAVT